MFIFMNTKYLTVTGASVESKRCEVEKKHPQGLIRALKTCNSA